MLASPYDLFQEHRCRLHRPLLPPWWGLRLQPRRLSVAPPSRKQENDTGVGDEYIWVTPITNPLWTFQEPRNVSQGMKLCVP